MSTPRPTPETTAHPRFAEALRTLGIEDLEVRRFPDATRTAAEAIGCEPNEIVKSLILDLPTAGAREPALNCDDS